jgi:hypothetical protein
MENFGKFMAGLLVLIINPIISGFVVLKLWLWFVVPIFGAQPLRLVESIGLIFLISYVFYKYQKPSDGFWSEFGNRVFSLIFMAAFVLFSGWIIQLFM